MVARWLWTNHRKAEKNTHRAYPHSDLDHSHNHLRPTPYPRRKASKSDLDSLPSQSNLDILSSPPRPSSLASTIPTLETFDSCGQTPILDRVLLRRRDTSSSRSQFQRSTIRSLPSPSSPSSSPASSVHHPAHQGAKKLSLTRGDTEKKEKFRER